MTTTRRGRLVVAVAALAGLATPLMSPADSVKDPANIAQRVKNLREIQKQIETTRDQIDVIEKQIETLKDLINDPGGFAFDRAERALELLRELEEGDASGDWERRVPIDAPAGSIDNVSAQAEAGEAYVRERIATISTATDLIEESAAETTEQVAEVVTASNAAVGVKGAQQAGAQLDAIHSAELEKLKAVRMARLQLAQAREAEQAARQAAIAALVRRETEALRGERPD